MRERTLTYGGISDWTAIGTSDGLSRKAVQRTLVHDADLAVWRGEDGQVRVWQNRCPHRGMRLSFGFVRGNRLTCLYHGWTYDGTGACALIPAHPQLTPPKTITVTTYSAAESGGLIWVSSSPLALEAPNIEGSWRAIRSLHIEAGPAAVLPTIEASDLDGAVETGFALQSLRSARIRKFANGSRLICALQEISERQSMLHIAVEGADDVDRDLRIDAWARKIRRAAENRSAIPDRERLEGAKA